MDETTTVDVITGEIVENPDLKVVPKSATPLSPTNGTPRRTSAQIIYDLLQKLNPKPNVSLYIAVEDILDELINDRVIDDNATNSAKAWYTLINLATVNKRQAWLLDVNTVYTRIARELGTTIDDTTPEMWFTSERGVQDLWTLLAGMYDDKLKADRPKASGE
jgi:hypothetical protein